MVKTTNDVTRHKELCEGLHDTYMLKNRDYGNAFSESIQEFGTVVGVARLSDKMNRIKQLEKTKTFLVKDESIKDTLLDMANYAVMLYMEYEREENKDKEEA